MTNDKQYQFPYNCLKRLGLDANLSQKIARSNCITVADKEDLDDIWQLCKFYKYILPFRDSLDHILRNTRNVSAVSLIHTSHITATHIDGVLEGTVTEEEVAGYICVAPLSTASVRLNLIKVKVPLLIHNLSLGEKEVSDLIYECLYQYCMAKTTTQVPTKLEVTFWLDQLETNYFKTVVGYLNAIFKDSYSPLQVQDIGYETFNPNDKPLEIGKPNASSKALLIRQRKNLNNPNLHQEMRHTLTFPRLPGPMK